MPSQQSHSLNKLELRVKNLFKSTYTSNCHLEDIQITQDQLDSLLSLDIFTILNNLSTLIDSLLLFKKSSLKEEKASLIHQNEQLETLLQKLEAEIRNHIRLEQELKLQKEDAETEKNHYMQEVNILRLQAKNPFSEKIEQLENLLNKKNNIIHKLELDFVKLRSGLESPFMKKKRSKLLQNTACVKIDNKIAEAGRSPHIRTKSNKRLSPYPKNRHLPSSSVS